MQTACAAGMSGRMASIENDVWEWGNNLSQDGVGAEAPGVGEGGCGTRRAEQRCREEGGEGEGCAPKSRAAAWNAPLPRCRRHPEGREAGDPHVVLFSFRMFALTVSALPPMSSVGRRVVLTRGSRGR